MDEAAGARVLREYLDRWAAAGIIDADQASRIEAAEQARAQALPRRRLPLVAEVLGYLGAVFAITAVGVTLHQFWKNVPPAAELAVAGVIATGLLVAGAAVRTGSEAAFARLRSVLWLLGTASAASFVAVLTGRYLHLADTSVALCAEAAWLACAIPLWWRARSALQHLAAFGGVVALVETGLDRIDPHVGSFGFGLALWVLGGVWGIAVHRGYFVPRTAGILLSGAGLLTGAIIAMDEAPGQALGVATVAGLLAAGILVRRVLLIGIGALGTLYVIPDVAQHYLPHSVAGPLAVAVIGLVLLGTALWLARFSRRRGRADQAPG